MAFAAPLIPAAISFLGSGAGLTVLAGATAGLAGLTAIQQGNYASAVAKNNAQIAEQNAARLSEAAQTEAQRSDIDYRALIAEQMAQQGASGFDILGRSATSARMLTRRTGRRQARDIRLEGETEARNRLQEAANFRAEGKQAKRQGYLSAAGSALNFANTAFGPHGTLVSGRRRRTFGRGGTRRGS